MTTTGTMPVRVVTEEEIAKNAGQWEAVKQLSGPMRPFYEGWIQKDLEDAAARSLLDHQDERRAVPVDAFLEWLDRTGYDDAAAAEALGYKEYVIKILRNGKTIPMHVALACAAISAGISPII